MAGRSLDSLRSPPPRPAGAVEKAARRKSPMLTQRTPPLASRIQAKFSHLSLTVKTGRD